MSSKKALGSIFYLIFFIFLIPSCKQDKITSGGLKEKDLISEGVPLKIKAPEDAEIKVKVENFYKDITVKKGRDYFVQIISTEAAGNDIIALKQELESEVRKNLYFNRIILEDQYGFVFEKEIGEGKLNYDFRHIKIEGDQQFIFQAGLYGVFTKEQVMKMYESVK